MTWARSAGPRHASAPRGPLAQETPNRGRFKAARPRMFWQSDILCVLANQSWQLIPRTCPAQLALCPPRATDATFKLPSELLGRASSSVREAVISDEHHDERSPGAEGPPRAPRGCYAGVWGVWRCAQVVFGVGNGSEALRGPSRSAFVGRLPACAMGPRDTCSRART